jgi:anthranilate phosphoribosyltransferase
MKPILSRIIAGNHLSMEEAEQVMDRIMEGEATVSQIAGFLTALRMKGETVEEIAGLVRSMRKHAVSGIIDAPDVLDTCGTGGSGISKFNVSTAAAFVTAAAGIPIAKHGNRAISGKSGSADVLQALGVNIELTPAHANECLRETGICFMFAPLYHQSMKHAMIPRKELGFKTVFNILGPLTNPAGAKRQVIGVFSPLLLEKVAQVLQLLGSERVMVVHGSDGLDEITVTGPTQVVELKKNRIFQYEIDPKELGLGVYAAADMEGGAPEHNASIMRNVLLGEKGAYRDVVVLNAAASIYVFGKASSLQEGVSIAQSMIDSGKAYATLQRLLEVSHRHGKELAP